MNQISTKSYERDVKLFQLAAHKTTYSYAKAKFF